MSSTNDRKSLPHRSAIVAAGVAISAMLTLVTFVGPAQAAWDGHDGYRRSHHYYNGGYYRAPPVAYDGRRYGYYPPPVVYGPGAGISLPFVNLNIR